MNTKTVTAAMIVIGNEILSGRTQDKNVAYTGKRLNEVGVQLLEVRVVPDIRARIVEAVNTLRTQYDYVFTSGGIGPTHDDITSESIAAAFNVPWDFHEDAYKTLESYYAEGEFTPARQKMAKTPVGAGLLPNPVSGAPGFFIENVYVMAGIPNIMQAMLDGILPTLRGGAVVVSRTVVCALPESRIAENLGAIQERFPSVDIGSYPRYQDGKFMTSLVLRAADTALLAEALTFVVDMVKQSGEVPEVLDQ